MRTNKGQSPLGSASLLRTTATGAILLAAAAAAPAHASTAGTVVNPGFETGDFTGWTTEEGTVGSTSYPIDLNWFTSSPATRATIVTAGDTDSFTTTGIDNILPTAGADTLTVSNTDQVAGFNQIQLEDFFDGGGGTDTIFIDNQDIDLEGVNTDSTHGFHNYEGVTFLNATDFSQASFDALQFGGDLISTALTVTGVNGGVQIVIVNNAANFSAAGWTLTNWDDIDSVILGGTGSADVLTGSSGSDRFLGFAGSDTLDGGIGKDQFFGGLGKDHLTGGDDADL